MVVFAFETLANFFSRFVDGGLAAMLGDFYFWGVG
jgi:hypothetical protein